MVDSEQMEDLRIGQAAEKFGLTVPQLRDWDKEGLITTYRGSRNARVIPASEFKKIERIKEILADSSKTFEDVRTELYKDRLVRKDEKEKEQNEITQAMAQAFDQSKMAEFMAKTMESLANELKEVKSELHQVKESQKESQKLLQDGPAEEFRVLTQELKNIKEQNEKQKQLNEELVKKIEKMNEQLTNQIAENAQQIEKREEEKKKRTGWLRIFSTR